MACFWHVLCAFYLHCNSCFVFDRATTAICFCFCTFFLSLRQRLLHSRNTMKNQHFPESPYSILIATKLRNGKGGCRLVILLPCFFDNVMFMYLYHQRFEKLRQWLHVKCTRDTLIFFITCIVCLRIFL